MAGTPSGNSGSGYGGGQQQNNGGWQGGGRQNQGGNSGYGGNQQQQNQGGSYDNNNIKAAVIRATKGATRVSKAATNPKALTAAIVAANKDQVRAAPTTPPANRIAKQSANRTLCRARLKSRDARVDARGAAFICIEQRLDGYRGKMSGGRYVKAPPCVKPSAASGA